jgi:hypothetical protein
MIITKELQLKYPNRHLVIIRFKPPNKDTIDLICRVPNLEQFNSITQNNIVSFIQDCVIEPEINTILNKYPAAINKISNELITAFKEDYEEESKKVMVKLNSYDDNISAIANGFNSLINNKDSVDKKAFIIYCSRLLHTINSFLTKSKS